MSDTPTPSQAAEKAIREALEAGPTLGQWSIMKSYGSGARCSVKAGLARIAVPSVTNLNWEANAALIAACNPEAMTALLSQLAEMRAEVERLRKNDARYRWLRAKAGPELLYGREQYTRSDLVCGLEGDELDERIDAALAEDGKDGAR